MFTGIIEEVGKISSVSSRREGLKLRVRSQRLLDGLGMGDSVSVNGVCLTVTGLSKTDFSVDVVRESLARSAFDKLRVGDPVNLERAMRSDGRFGGHLVSGHVDGTGRVSRMIKRGASAELAVDCPAELLKYVVRKGSVAVNGVSLTVSDVDQRSMKVALVPFTLRATTLGRVSVGDIVNIEVDLLAKYVEKQRV